MDAAERETPIASPCVRNCSLDPISQICLGCGRHLDEIVAWSNATNETRLRILDNIRARRASSS